MMIKRLFYVIAFLFLYPSCLSALEPVLLYASVDKYDVGKHIEYYEDVSGELTIETIASADVAWKKNKRDVPNFGFTDTSYWFRFSLRNSMEKHQRRYLEIAYPLIEHLELYVPLSEGGFTKHVTGTSHSIASRDVTDRNFVYPISVPTGQKTFYIRVNTRSPLEMPLLIWSETGFIKRCNWQIPLLWGYFGMLLMIMFYYFCLFITEEKESHLYCALFILSIALCNLFLSGLAFQYVLTKKTWINEHGGYYLAFCGVLTGLMFARSNFKPFKVFNWFETWVVRPVFVSGFALMLLYTFTGNMKAVQVTLFMWASLWAVVVLITVIYGAFSTTVPNYTMLFGFTVFIIGGLSFLMKSLGYLPSNIVTRWGHQVGSAVMVLFFAQGLYENITRRQKTLTELSKSRNELERIINRSPATALLLKADEKLSVDFVSNNIREFGYRPEDLLEGKENYIEMVHPEDRDMFLTELCRNIQEKQQKRFSQEYRILSKKGGVFWVDNRTWIRRDDTGAVTHIQCLIMNITTRKNLEKELRYLHQIERTFSAVSSNFISLPPEEISAGVDYALKMIGEFAGFERTHVFLLSDDGNHVSNTNEWCAPGVEPRIEALKNLDLWRLPRIARLFSDRVPGENFVELPGAEDIPEDDFLKELLCMKDAGYVIMVPLISESRILGVLGFDSSFEKELNRKYTRLLTNVAQILSNVFARMHYDESIKTYQAELRQLSSELLLAEERERRRIAIDLHDRIGHALANSRIKLGLLQKEIRTESSHGLVGEIRALIEQSIDDTQTLTFNISPHILYDVGLEAAVDWLAEQTENEHGIKIEFYDDMSYKPLSDTSKVLLYQAVRELVFNIVKHSRANLARIHIMRDGEHLMIEIRDNGIGFEVDRTFSCDKGKTSMDRDGFGLFSVRERVQLRGGRLDIKSEDGMGTCIRIIYPLRTEEDPVCELSA